MNKTRAIVCIFPNIAIAAIKKPNAYVSESPGKIFEGYQLKIKKANNEATVVRPTTVIQYEPFK